MISSTLKGLFRFQEANFLLSMSALACLPLALINLLQGADLSLSLPITFLGMLIARGLSSPKIKKTSVWVILLCLGPLVLIARIGGMWKPLFEFVRDSFAFMASVFRLLYFNSPVNFSSMLLARNELLQNSLGLGKRFALWFLGFLQGVEVEDPVVRTLIWCLVLWLVAAWAGWQIHRKDRLLTGIFPTTLLLAFIVNYTGKETEILLTHLALLLFLLGLTSFAEQKSRWEITKTDYAESTSSDTLIVTVMLTVMVMSISFLASRVSVREIMDELRERRENTTEVQGESLGLEPVKDNAGITGLGKGLPRSHLINSGPELSRQLAMTISTGELPSLPEMAHVPAPRHYWRTLTYQEYNGRGWWNPSAFGEDVPPGKKLTDEILPGYKVLRQSVTFASETGDRLYWAGTLLSADVPFQIAWLRKAKGNSLLHSNMLAAVALTKSYQAESLTLNVDAKTLRNSSSVYPDWVRRQYLALPDSVPARVHSLARDLTASKSTPYDRALAIEDYLRAFPYTLEVDQPPAVRDVVDYFLFDLKQGYCDYYATSMVVLARAAGLPARLVVGYASGAYDFERAQYIVTENYAHTWVEIYFTNIGWVEFEPTAAQPAILYEEENKSPLSATEVTPVKQPLKVRFVFFSQAAIKNAWFPVSLFFFCGFLWIGFDSLRLSRMDPSQAIQLLYKRLRRLARPVTGYGSKNQTAHSYASTLIWRLSTIENSSHLKNWLSLSHNEIENLTELFSRSLFAPQPPSRADANAAIRNWSRLQWRLVLANVLRIIKRFQLSALTPQDQLTMMRRMVEKNKKRGQ